MEKQTKAHPYNEILLFGNQNEQTNDTYRNIDESQKPYAKLNEPVAKGHTLYNSIYITHWKIRTEIRSGGWGEGKRCKGP